MEKHFMIDIETTGIDPKKEDLLQIGLLECDFDGSVWHPGRSLDIIQHTDRKPESAFAKEHMAALYEECNQAPAIDTEQIRSRLLNFFRECGSEPPMVYLMGWNASNFDVPFLVHKGVIEPSFYEIGPDGKDTMRGDFHYRIYELGGAISLIANKFPTEARNALITKAKALDRRIAMPEGKEHDALFDCYAQLKILNGLIAMAKGDA